MSLLTYQVALRRIQDSIVPAAPQTVSWRAALQCALAEDIHAREVSPAFTNSAVDGFAVRSADVVHATDDSSVRLTIVEDIFANQSLPQHTVGAHQTAKIMTGAPVPDGADAVVMVERTRQDGGEVEVFMPVSAGQNLRRQGEEIQVGDVILTSGSYIDSAAQSLLASQGIFEVSVIRPPKIALLATGDELVEPEEKIHAAQIRNVNAYTLSAEIRKLGGEPIRLEIGRDSKDRLRASIESGLAQADMLLTSGGVSAGEKDLLPSLLTEMGMNTVFHKLSVKPGKPLLFGLLGEKIIFGLPGNVVSTLTSFHLFVKPAIRLFMGRSDWQNPVWYVRAGQPLANRGGRTNFMRCRIEHDPIGLPLAYPTGAQGSGMLSSFIGADGFMVIPADMESVEEHQVLEFIPIHTY